MESPEILPVYSVLISISLNLRVTVNEISSPAIFPFSMGESL